MFFLIDLQELFVYDRFKTLSVMYNANTFSQSVDF